MPKFGRTRSRQWPHIAGLCDGEELTIYGIAKKLGTRTGAIKSVLDSMEADGLLRVRSGERGQLYALTRSGRTALRAVDDAAPARLALPAGSRVLLVVDEGRTNYQGLLGRLAAEPELRWAARLDGLVRWLLVFGSGDAAVVDRASAVVEAAGGRPIVIRADEVMNAAQVREYAMRLSSGQAAVPEIVTGETTS